MGRPPSAAAPLGLCFLDMFLIILYHRYLWIFLIYSLYIPYIFPSYVKYVFPCVFLNLWSQEKTSPYRFFRLDRSLLYTKFVPTTNPSELSPNESAITRMGGGKPPDLLCTNSVSQCGVQHQPVRAEARCEYRWCLPHERNLDWSSPALHSHGLCAALPAS